MSTAMPKIAGQLGDLHLYAWVFSAYLLTQTAMTVVFGKLADTYGRKPVLLVGIGIFLVGSLLCGTGLVDPVTDRLPAAAGRGRRGDPAGVHDGRGRPVSGAGARQGAGLAGQRVGAVLRARAAGGRADHPASVLGLDLLDQPAGGPALDGRVRRLPARGRVGRARPRGRAGGGVVHAGDGLAHAGADADRHRQCALDPVRLRRMRRCGRPVRVAGTAGGEPHRGLPAVVVPPDRHRQRRDTAERDGGDRADRVPADVRAGRAEPVAAGRRVHAHGDGAGLAGGCDAGRAQLQPVRPARHPAVRRRAAAGRRLRVRAACGRAPRRCWVGWARW